MLWNKKRTGLFLLVLISIGLVGCSPEATIQEREPESEAKWVDAKEGFEALEGVWIETEYETYEIGTKSLRVKWFNTLGDPMMYGAGFEIQKKVGNVWKQVSKVKAIEYAFNTIGYILNPSDARWQSYNLICYTDGLTTGEYRVSTTFSRQNLEGVDYGPGNYPNYQVYGTFSVKDLSVKRKLSILDHTKFEYLNELYGFSIMLPKAWEGFQLLIEQETGDDTFDTLSKKIDASYVVVKIRHPKWSIEEPYQDIAFGK